MHALLESFGLGKAEISEEEFPLAEYGVIYQIDGHPIGHCLKLDEKTQNHFDIRYPVYHMQLDLKTLWEMSQDRVLHVADIPKFPTVRRDLALLLDDAVSFSEVEAIAWSKGGQILTDLRLFDIYKDDKHLGKGKKSYALALYFNHPNKTLRDKDVDKEIKKMTDAFSSELSAELRR